MASTSTHFQIIDDDDDGFDWEAAVQQIDLACNGLISNNNYTYTYTNTEKPISSFNNNFNSNIRLPQNPFQNSHKDVNFSTKQSTLDRFIAGVSKTSVKKPENQQKPRDFNDNDINGAVYECEGVEELNGFVKIDPEAAKTWIYPVNVPRRDYQFSITKTALFSNTLVVLPTGLGKTLIAAVVMYNYFRWFPEGKIVFAAPSRPLVMQQIEACHNIVGIPQEWTIDLTGQTNAANRAVFWRDKRVFFVTPQVFERDIQSGSCMVKYLVCLVIDEAHRAMGNFAYCVAVRELLDAHVQLRILALSATPGSKKETIQNVINNLQISTLEHRSENDADVLQYVHERKLELIQVPMGNEADEVNNLILEVMRPFSSRLSAFGLFPKRDFQTLSPHDLLNSREKFRQEPPRDLPESQKGEIENCFSVLITLYHVKKLLSGHGIRPALEMLEEKLTQRYFARLVSRNEVLLKAKLIMQQTVSHGAPSPKLAKLLEVLTDHFKVHDRQNSRVIIFSNFRGSVRDILNALTSLGEFVKATDFIGQSSGKTLKGQSQKVQQAVLQKFRAGGFNVIVATSIAEEGLDIMEVDLVICFDANISPLRMTQRMGRTGRKNEGRVVVLACEGSELKGYMRKRANNKAIQKHMHNGGVNSFSFHSSPRMIPHIYKPEVQFVQFSIEEFVPRGKNLKDDNPTSVPMYKTQLNDADKDLLAQYFPASGETSWKPSLIVFPRIQAYPSSVNKVAHSSRTMMLIDTMQYLQGLKFSDSDETLLTEGDDILYPCLRVDMVEEPYNRLTEKSDYQAEEEKLQAVVESDIELEEVSGTKNVHIEDLQKHKPSHHSFMFDTEFVSVDDHGNVLVLSLPQLPLKLHFKSVNENHHEERSVHVEMKFSTVPGCAENENAFKSSTRNPSASVAPAAKEICHSPVSNMKSNEQDISAEEHNVECDATVMELEDDPTDEHRDAELSPRLTNFIKSGVVPESPIHRNAQTPISDLVANAPIELTPHISVAKGTQTPLAKLSNTSNSIDWLLDIEVNPQTVEQRKFKRLRKHGDINGKAIPESNEPTNKNRRGLRTGCCNSATKFVKGKKRRATDAAVVYIEEEAEISSDGMALDDDEEEEELDNSSYDGSFIDDGTNPTGSTTQAEASRPDMLAVYRRSLLSQSPYPRLPNCSTNHTPDSVVQSSRLGGSGSSSGTKNVRTPQIGLESSARNSQLACDKISSDTENRRRKLNYYQEKAVPIVNLDKEFSSLPNAVAKESSVQIPAENIGNNVLLDEDDLFYAGIDLDAIEEEANRRLALISQGLAQKAATTSGQPPPFVSNVSNFGDLDAPSFDLGSFDLDF